MNSTFVTWLVGAAVIGLGLFFVLGTPAVGPEPSAAGQTVDASSSAALVSPTDASASSATGPAAYWQAVTPGSATAGAATIVSGAVPSAVPASAMPDAPCPSCATRPATATLPAPQGAPSLVAAGATYVAAPHAGAAVPPPGGLMGGCGTPTAPCAEAPCGPALTCGLLTCPSCSHGPACGAAGCLHAAGAHVGCEHNTRGQAPACEAQPVCDRRPKISRNGPSCVDECSFAQFYSTLPLPVCQAIRFRWAATRGEFLDPTSPTPIYFAPSTGFPGGEDVLINLTVTDAEGNQYTDQMKVHVNDAD